MSAPGVYTGNVLELQQSFPHWYNQVYSEACPSCWLPSLFGSGSAADAEPDGLQVQQDRVPNLGHTSWFSLQGLFSFCGAGLTTAAERAA